MASCSQLSDSQRTAVRRASVLWKSLLSVLLFCLSLCCTLQKAWPDLTGSRGGWPKIGGKMESVWSERSESSFRLFRTVAAFLCGRSLRDFLSRLC